MRSGGRVRGLGVALCLLAPNAARANDGARVALARTLFDEGRALIEAGRVDEACAKFEESQRIDPAGGTLLNLAVCREEQGRTALAWALFRDGLAQAQREGRTEREAIARGHLARLSGALVRLRVTVSPDVRGRDVIVSVDGAPLPPAAYGVAYPVDPGPHTIAALTDGRPSFRGTVDAREPGHTYEVEVRGEPRPVVDAARAGFGRSTAFWATIATSGLFVAASAVTGALALRDDAYVSDHCSRARDFCDVDDAGSVASRARGLAWTSTGALALGLIAAGLAFLLPRPIPRGPGGP